MVRGFDVKVGTRTVVGNWRGCVADLLFGED